jgi:KDO2-lipid IV(A) lauroyltransferase
VEFAALWLLVRGVGVLPRPVARGVGIGIGHLARVLLGKLRRVGQRNLAMALPELSEAERERILRGVYVSLGRQLAEFCRLGRLTRENAHELIEYEGLEHYLAAKARGKGVLFLTAHLGAWELSSYFHSLMGHPLRIVMRGLDNPLVNEYVNRVRTRHGNTTFDKDNYVRGLLAAMRRNEAVGILMDTNMTPPQGVFVDYFGIKACTPGGLARIALHTDATIVPGFALWDETAGKYKMTFAPAVELVRTGDAEADVVANTQRCTAVIEEFVRRHPEQWLWVHRRWKTRPAGEAPLY